VALGHLRMPQQDRCDLIVLGCSLADFLSEDFMNCAGGGAGCRIRAAYHAVLGVKDALARLARRLRRSSILDPVLPRGARCAGNPARCILKVCRHVHALCSC
jgi:hypothetical protein